MTTQTHEPSPMLRQAFNIPKPTFTEKDLPDQGGKVHIITGGYAGVGFELAKLLYAANATLYVAGRSPTKAEAAMSSLRAAFPNSIGRVEFLEVDLADFTTIKRAAQEFIAKETRLDVLVNNAGVMNPPQGSKTPQGHDLQTATNIYGPWLFTQFLIPQLRETARIAPRGTVRVCWAASSAVDLGAPKGGVVFGSDGLVDDTLKNLNSYGQTKSANALLGVEGARRWGKDGIISNSFNPGNLKSELGRDCSLAFRMMTTWMLHPVSMGAWTELYAGWSSDITLDENGLYIIPWGRIGYYNTLLQIAGKTKAEGGEGKAAKLWEACEKVCKPYM